MDTIQIEGLELTCIVGLRPHERVRKQGVVIDLELGLALATAGRTGRIAHTCDYDLVAESVRALLCFREYHLVEVATEELAAMLFGHHPALERVTVRLAKPAALAGRARNAAVRITRSRADFPRRPWPGPGGTVEVLLETREAGLYVATIAPGRSLDPALRAALHRGPRRATAWLVSGALDTPSGELVPGTSLELDASPASNRRAESALVFLCSSPGLDPDHRAPENSGL